MDENAIKAKKAHDIIRLLRPLYRNLEKSVAQGVEQDGLTVIKRAVMEPIFDSGPKTVPQIAAGLIVERQFIQRVVDELVQEALLVKQPNPEHKRSWLIQLTDKGQGVFQNIKQREANRLSQIVGHISAEHLEQAYAVMKHLTEAFSESNAEN